jgi:hypothetical protein
VRVRVNSDGLDTGGTGRGRRSDGALKDGVVGRESAIDALDQAIRTPVRAALSVLSSSLR